MWRALEFVCLFSVFLGDNQGLKEARGTREPESISVGCGCGFEYRNKHKVTIVIVTVKNIVIRSKTIRKSVLTPAPEKK